MKLEVEKLERIILRDLDKLRKEGDRGYVHVLKLWMALARSIKIKDPQEAYRRNCAALELLREKGLIKERAGSAPLSAGEVKLTSKGIRELDRVNRGFMKRAYYYFEKDIKSEFVKYIFLIIYGLVIFFLGMYVSK